MILLQQVVAADAKYSVLNVVDLTAFDLHNDSPFNVGISFGSDTGIKSADYFTSAHSILFGLKPIYASQRSIGGVKFNGSIYVYTQTPSGGAGANLSQAPASQITLIGYQTGSQPAGTASMSRMSNIGNGINLPTTATSVINDGNPAGASIVESTVSGDGSSAVSITNDAQINFGNGTHAASMTLTGNEHITGTSQIDGTFQSGSPSGVNGAGINTNVGLGIKTTSTTQVGLIIFPAASGYGADLLRVYDNLFNVMFGVGPKGHVNMRGSVQAIANNGTINTDRSFASMNTSGGAITGVIMAPGVTDGQLMVLTVPSGSVAFAIQSTSNVALGNSVTLNTFGSAWFIWDNSVALWFCHKLA